MDGLQNLVNEWTFPRAQMEAGPTLLRKDPCLTLCWTSGAWFGSLGSRSALRGMILSPPHSDFSLLSGLPLLCPSCLGDPDGMSRDRKWAGMYPQPPGM